MLDADIPDEISDDNSDDTNDGAPGGTVKTPVPPRIVEAVLTRDKVSLGPIEIIGSTKHGATTLMSVEDPNLLRTGDSIKTRTYVLSARDFIVVRKHNKPMKLAGTWFEVKAVAAAKPSRPVRR